LNAVQWNAPLSLLKKQMPWTMQELRPQVSDIRGRSDIHYRTFDIRFEGFCVQIVLRGQELDEIRISDRGCGSGARIDHIQNVIASRVGSKGKVPNLVLNYRDLDAFLKENHKALDAYYSGEISHPHAEVPD